MNNIMYVGIIQMAVGFGIGFMAPTKINNMDLGLETTICGAVTLIAGMVMWMI